MPRPKKISDDAIKTTAQIPSALHSAVFTETRKIDLNFSLFEAINEGLMLWLKMRQGDRHMHKMLSEILTDQKRIFEGKPET